MAVIDEPATARAVERCLIARSIDKRGETRTHPRRCEWCDYPLEVLRQQLDGFNAWAGWSESGHSYERHEVRVWVEWARTHAAEAEAQIVAAQGLLEPMDDPPPPPAHGAPPAPIEEDVTAWLNSAN